MADAPDLTPEELFAAFEAMDIEDQVRTGLWYRDVDEGGEPPIVCKGCSVWIEDMDCDEMVPVIRIAPDNVWTSELIPYCDKCRIDGTEAIIETEEGVHPSMSYSNDNSDPEYRWRQISLNPRFQDHYLVVPESKTGSKIDASDISKAILEGRETNIFHRCPSGECYTQTCVKYPEEEGGYYDEIEVTFCTCFDGSEPNKFVRPLADNFSEHHWEGWEDEFNQALESSSREDLEGLIEACREVLHDREIRRRNQLPSVSGGGLWGESWSNLELLIHTIETLIEKKEDSWGPVDNESLKTRLKAFYELWTKPTRYDCPECGARGASDWGPRAPCRNPEGEITKPHENRIDIPDTDYLGSLFG